MNNVRVNSLIHLQLFVISINDIYGTAARFFIRYEAGYKLFSISLWANKAKKPRDPEKKLSLEISWSSDNND